MQKFVKQKRRFSRRLGAQDANILLTNMGKGAELESLGPLLGMLRIIKNQLSRREYLTKYGHRGPHEFELSIADLAENEEELELKLSQYGDTASEIEELLSKQRLQYSAAIKRLRERLPYRWKSVSRQLSAAAEGPQIRESARSEWTRVYRLNRDFVIKAGELTGIGGDVFFLYLDEILQGLATGEQPGVQYIAARKENYARYQALPPLPAVIRGRFDPYIWMKDPRRRMDLYDPEMPAEADSGQELLKGFPGAAGRVEGVVRVLARPEDGNLLLPGEVLVASTTNALRAAMISGISELTPEELATIRERNMLVMSVPELRAATLNNMLNMMDLIIDIITKRTEGKRDDMAVHALAGAVIGVNISVVLYYAEHPDADFAALLEEGLSKLEAGFPL
ncbi:hypothetical protein KC345_g6044 [Hortaea werneckii]|nr:hypothetical protein KC345_g6044 [Hortaea werneckii]